MKKLLLLTLLVFITACNKTKQDAKYVVNKVTTSCLCQVQLTTSRPQIGKKHLGPFDTKEEAINAMCNDLDPTMSDQNKCWEINPKDTCIVRNSPNIPTGSFKLVKSYPRPSNYAISGKVYSFEVIYPTTGIKRYWSSLINTINDTQAEQLAKCTYDWYFENKPGSAWLVKNNWWVDVKLEDVNAMLIYDQEKYAETCCAGCAAE